MGDVDETVRSEFGTDDVGPPGNLTFGDKEPDAPLPGTAVSTTAGNDLEANPTGNVGTVTGDQVVLHSGPLAGTSFPAVEVGGEEPAPTPCTT